METLFKSTSKEDQNIAIASLLGFQTVSETVKFSLNKSVKIKIQENGDFITIPKKALTLLTAILQNMAEGKTISIVTSNPEISTQQAADMLNISRPHLVKLLETKNIPFKKVGSHRRILLEDIQNYQEQQTKQRESQLQFLANQAQD